MQRLYEPPTSGFLLTRRNLILSLTILVMVANWYGGRRLSLLTIGVLVLTLPLIIGFSRLVAAGRQRLESAFAPTAPRRTGPQRLQLANVAPLCALLALTVHTGVYNPVALQLTPGLHRVLLAAFALALVTFVLLSLAPLRQVPLGSNLLITAATIFLTVQLISMYRPPVDAVTVGTPAGR